jgi:hypothetical protein
LQGYATSIETAIDKYFWLEDEGYYAMRIKPDGTVDKTPFSIGLLCPLWVDALPADAPKVVSSVVSVLDKLYRKNGFIRLIPEHDQTVTMAIGYLIYSLKKIRHPELDRSIKDLLKWADPSGTFGEYLDEEKTGPVQCYEHMAHRNRMWESGINTDALFFALTGYDPYFYENRIALEPWLPKGWDRHEITNHRVGENRLSLESKRIKQGEEYRLQGTFRHPLNVDFTVTTTNSKSQIACNGEPVPVGWAKNQFGILHQTLRLQLEQQPITITVTR